MFISDSASLASFCGSLEGVPYIAVDTEFVRERTYFAELALIQVAHGEHAAAIDPLAPGIDLAPLGRLLHDAAITKVVHSGNEDLELLLGAFGQMPTPVFDTQIAASMCGSDAQVGYARLVQERIGVTLDKGSQRTDWTRRPLSPKQLAYALADVTHLCTLYERLVSDLDERGRTEWAAGEMVGLTDPHRYEIDPRETWRRLRMRRPTRRSLAILRELSAWRENRARSRNLPRPWILKNDALLQLAEAAPTTLEALKGLSAVARMGHRWRDADRVLEVVTRALNLPEDTWPEVPERIDTRPHEDLLKALRQLLKERCEAAQVAPTLVATRRELERFVASNEPNIPAMEGWRREVFGEAALALKRA
ncbi:MAG: ribonuclease D [Myxococcota bacterium]|nr:ribonuclease D [Myxococcota bacterium]